jgi:hypothetical protein
VTGQLAGFASSRRAVQFDQRGQQIDLTLSVGSLSETVTVNAESPLIDTKQSSTRPTSTSTPP